MKLDKKIATKVAVLSSALLVTGICISAPMDKEAISSRCELIYNNLDRLSEEQNLAPCARTVRYAGWVMQGAAALVYSERYSEALKNLRIADGNLSRVYFESQECAYFSPKVKPSLDGVKILIAELENISN